MCLRFIFIWFFVLATFDSYAQELTGREILEQMEVNQRSISDSALTRMRLSSCAYGLKAKKITCTERPRTKELESVSDNHGASAKDTRAVYLVLGPVSEKGVGMLRFDYDDPKRENETWLYLSALGKVKRIASGDSDGDSEPGSFFGSEFTTEDMDVGKLAEYEIDIIGETVVNGRHVWQVETIPNQSRWGKERYGRSVLYVDKERFVSLRTDLYDKRGKEIKRMMSSRVERVKGVWTARSITMINLVSNRLSNIAILEINTGLRIPDSFFSQRTLEDAAFREVELDKLRAQIGS